MPEDTIRMRILVFLHGTCIMHKNALGLSRGQIIQQIIDNTDESISDFASYIPIGDVVKKLTSWHNQGAEILYLSSHLNLENVKKDEIVLKKYKFPEGPIFYRWKRKDWNLTIEKAKPDIIIEDDCESIGGTSQMTYPNLQPELQSKITSIVIKEFGGIDHLPNNIYKLKEQVPLR
ncbi:MAG: hypothetical protein ACFE94_14030 [Candidatus Hodarchaeota archaeon]